MRVAKPVPMRARIVLLAAAGMSDKDIAQNLLTDRRVAARWRARFLATGVDGLLQDATRPGRPRTAREAGNVEEVVRITLVETPAGATHWSTRTLAEYLGTIVPLRNTPPGLISMKLPLTFSEICVPHSSTRVMPAFR